MYEWLAARLPARPPRPADDDAPAGRGTSKRCNAGALFATGFAPTYPTLREGYAAMLG